METDPFPAFTSDIEYSIITSDVIKSFDCIAMMAQVNEKLVKKIFLCVRWE